MTFVPNPARPGGRKPVHLITDRAKRLRAQSTPPPGPRRCAYCGSGRYVEIDHVDGIEAHGNPENLTWACRSCNTRKGIVFRNAGRGRPVVQMNPGKESEGAKSLAQWVMAVMAMRGQSSEMSLGQAVRMVKATPPEKRSEYAAEIWRRRRDRGTDRRASEVPF